MLADDDTFLISPPGPGAFTAPWTAVRLTGHTHLARHLTTNPNEPEFVTASADGTVILGVTTEEYAVWLVIKDRPRQAADGITSRLGVDAARLGAIQREPVGDLRCRPLVLAGHPGIVVDEYPSEFVVCLGLFVQVVSLDRDGGCRGCPHATPTPGGRQRLVTAEGELPSPQGIPDVHPRQRCTCR